MFTRSECHRDCLKYPCHCCQTLAYRNLGLCLQNYLESFVEIVLSRLKRMAGLVIGYKYPRSFVWQKKIPNRQFSYKTQAYNPNQMPQHQMQIIKLIEYCLQTVSFCNQGICQRKQLMNNKLKPSAVRFLLPIASPDFFETDVTHQSNELSLALCGCFPWSILLVIPHCSVIFTKFTPERRGL